MKAVRTIPSAAAIADDENLDFVGGLAQTVTHELTHCLLNGAIDDDEHVRDGNQNGRLDEDDDRRYLMYSPSSALNFASGKFDNVTRGGLDLTSKQSVERT